LNSFLNPLLSLLLSFGSGVTQQSRAVTDRVDCGSWQECRDQALAAAGREEYELFHDLAWLAFRKGPKNDSSLMAMLARSQSLSGRPHDALIMLHRLTALDVVPDGLDDEDFRRVRTLPGWADLEASIESIKSSSTRPAPVPVTTIAAPPNPPTPTPLGTSARLDEAADAVRFSTDAFAPVGLAYDAVSNRFIVGDRHERKLSVIGELSHRISNFVGAESGGFEEIGALAIDAREGDLWVVSSSSDDTSGARLHKLQLISGRVLFTQQLPAGAAPARFADVAVTGEGAVLALDTLGRRVFRFGGGALRSNGLNPVAVLDVPAPVSIAPAPSSIVYLAHAEGISRLDLQAKSTRPLKVSGSVDVTGVKWIRWYGGSLVAIQADVDGSYRVVRIRLNGNGSTANRAEVLARGVALPDPSSVTIAGNTLYYLTRISGSPQSGESVIRRIKLK
jgi:hypothetical protein